MTSAQRQQPNHIPQPAAPPDPDDLPHALTFFVTTQDRRRILALLRRLHTDRASALLTALGLSEGDRRGE